MSVELEIVISQQIDNPNYPGITIREYRFTDLEEAQQSFNNLRTFDNELTHTSIKLVEVMQR